MKTYFVVLPYLPYIFGQTGLSKQYRPRWDATERGVSSGSTLFATHPAIFRQHRVVNCTGSNFSTYMVRSWGVWILRINTVGAASEYPQIKFCWKNKEKYEYISLKNNNKKSTLFKAMHAYLSGIVRIFASVCKKVILPGPHLKPNKEDYQNKKIQKKLVKISKSIYYEVY